MSGVILYVEGGGEQARVREGFHKLLERAGFVGRLPRVVACGGRQNAYDRFKTAALNTPDRQPMLLVDSEEPVTASSVWDHLHRTGQWARPKGVREEQGQLMVTSMETWLVADRQALQGFFGPDLALSPLPALADLEQRSPQEVLKSLKAATRVCGQPYKKGDVSFKIVALLDPATLEQTLPHFRKFLADLKRLSGETP